MLNDGAEGGSLAKRKNLRTDLLGQFANKDGPEGQTGFGRGSAIGPVIVEGVQKLLWACHPWEKR